MNECTIASVTAEETISDYLTPALSVAVATANGATGTATYAAGAGLFDGGARYCGRGMTKAAAFVNERLAPALAGKDSFDQSGIDSLILDTMAECGLSAVNVSSPVSVAVLKAAAKAKGIPLFRHVGGASAATLPVPGYLAASGSSRYAECSRAGGSPLYAFVAYDFSSQEEAEYALWEVHHQWNEDLAERYDLRIEHNFSMAIGKGVVKDDRELWELMAESIRKAGHEGRVGLHADITASAFFDPVAGSYAGLFDTRVRNREEMIREIVEMVRNFPFVIVQEPLESGDLEGFAAIRSQVDIQVASADIFGIDVEQLSKAASMGCINAAALRVQRYPTFSDCVAMVQACNRFGLGILPQDSAGEDKDVAHYAVGFQCGCIHMSGLSSHAGEMALIEEAIGPGSAFFGKHGLKGERFSLKQGDAR